MYAVLDRAVLAALDLVAPRRCAGCEAVAAGVLGVDAAALCEDCAHQIHALEPGPPLRHGGCDVHAAFVYEPPVSTILQRGKYAGRRSALAALAAIAGRRFEGLAPPGAIVPVPLGRGRLRERGYNQAALLAAGIAAVAGAACREGALVRVRDTPPQVGRDEAARAANVAGAFAWVGPPPPARLWLVDDVFTTGATTAAAAAAARAAGARDVAIVVAARVL